MNNRHARSSDAFSVASSLSHDPIEVTDDDYYQQTTAISRRPSWLPKIRIKKKKQQGDAYSITSSEQAVGSVISDPTSNNGHTRNSSDAQSLANSSMAQQTISSLETLKVSNQKQKPATGGSSAPEKHKNPWNKFKKIMGVSTNKGSSSPTSSNSSSPNQQLQRAQSTPARALSMSSSTPGSSSTTTPSSTPKRSSSRAQQHQNATGGGPFRRRFFSEVLRDSSTKKDNPTEQQQLLDDAIRGRLDGMDVLSLGPARFQSIEREASPTTTRSSKTTVVVPRPKLTTADMVYIMIACSGGKEPPEMILDGFFPDRDDRWTVRIETPTINNSKHQSPTKRRTFDYDTHPTTNNIPSLQSSTDEEEDNHTSSTTFCDRLPIQDLLESLWGKPDATPPTHTARSFTSNSDTVVHMEGGRPRKPDDVVQLAAECNVPIDVDDDAFLIDTAVHMRAIHEIAAASLQSGKFDDALQVFDKILSGLLNRYEEEPHYLIGTTRHNMGVVLLWQSKWREALEQLEAAVIVRTDSLPTNHADIAVSLFREAVALLALDRLEDAAVSLDRALQMHPERSSTRAKLLNNIGVVHYQRQDFVEALKSFTAALEIQRLWLDKKVRRETTVYDASVTLSNMGKLYLERKDYTVAHLVYEEALLLQTMKFRKDHDLVLGTLGSLAYTTAKEGDYKKSLQLYRGILRSQESRFGSNSRQCMETRGYMAGVLIKQQDYDAALKLLHTVHKWQKVKLPPRHPAIRHTKDAIKKLEQNLDGEVTVWV